MADQMLLIRTLVGLADSLVDEFDVVDLLTLLSDRCVEGLDVAAAGVMLATPSGNLQVVASSSDGMRTLELFQLQSDQGPCVDCYRTGKPIVNLDPTTVNGRWPTFAPHAVAAGYRSVHSLPMRLRGTTIGALDMFRTDDGALDEDEAAVAQAFADVATIAISQHQAALDAQQVNEQLSGALNSRIVIEQAKGKISEAANLNMDHAFQRSGPMPAATTSASATSPPASPKATSTRTLSTRTAQNSHHELSVRQHRRRAGPLRRYGPRRTAVSVWSSSAATECGERPGWRHTSPTSALSSGAERPTSALAHRLRY